MSTMSWLTVLLLAGAAALAYSEPPEMILTGRIGNSALALLKLQLPKNFALQTITIADEPWVLEDYDKFCNSTDALNVSKHSYFL